MNAFQIRRSAVQTSLNSLMLSPGRIGPAVWEFSLKNGSAFSVEASLQEDWLHVRMPLSDRADAASLWTYAAMNKGRRGFGKFALAPDAGTVEFRAEAPFIENADLTRVIHELIAEFKNAISELYYGNPSDEGVAPVPAGRPLPGKEDLIRLCSEAGWPCTERAPGKFVVDLHSLRGFYQAVIQIHPHGVHLAAEVAQPNNLSPAGKQGLAAFLLTVSRMTRLARASVSEQEGVVTACVETHFRHLSEAAELNEALASLSVASMLFGEEGRLFEHEDVARRYLAIRDISEKLLPIQMKGELVQ